MGTKAIAVIVIVAVAVTVGACLLLLGILGPAAKEAPGPNDAITAAATDEADARSVVDSQFRADFSSIPSDAAVSIEMKDVSSEYWKATATYGSESKTYWVPKEKPKGLRVQVGQSQTYAMTMTMSTGLGGTMSMDATFQFTVAEQTTYEGVPCYKIQMSGDATIAGMTVPYSGYVYVDTEDYKPRYMTLTATSMGQTAATEYFYNYTTNKLRIKMTVGGQTWIDTEMDIPQGNFTPYNTQDFLGENLYVGWSENFSFASDSSNYTIALTVTKEEQITVPAGTFRCYVLSATVPEIENMAGYDMTCNIWVNAQMTLVPKMEISVSYQGQNVLSMTMTLQDYSGY